MRVAIACLVVAGCGRIAFDPVADAGAPGLDDARIDAPRLACATLDIVVDLPQAPSAASPGIVWTGTEYYVVIRDPASGFALLQFSATGDPGPYYTVLPVSEPFTGMAWSGSTIGIVSYGGGETHWRSFDPVTHAVGSPVTLNVASAGDITRIAWAGDRFVVSWANTANVYARELSETGTPLTGELLLSTTGGPVTSIVATPTTYVIGVDRATNMGAVVTYQRASMLIQTLSIDTGASYTVQVAAGIDGRFASTFAGLQTGGAARVQLHDVDGTPLGVGIQSPLTPASTPFYTTLEPTSSGYRLTGINGANPHALVRAEIDFAGNVTSSQSMFASIMASNWGSPSVLAADGRSLLAFPYDSGANPTHLRLIQTCSN